jgi:glutamine amidotransferase
MTKLSVGIVDYGVGNHASVKQCVHRLGMRCRVSDQPAVLDECDLLLLPGVGAFPLAMQALRQRSLAEYIVARAAEQKPILGICLGMQLLADASCEGGHNKGLGLVPGEIVPLGSLKWHIGWNTVEQTTTDHLFSHDRDQSFYFNHAYVYQGPEEFQVCTTGVGDTMFASAVRRHKIVGLQFHPERSQQGGRELLKNVIEGLCSA